MLIYMNDFARAADSSTKAIRVLNRKLNSLHGEAAGPLRSSLFEIRKHLYLAYHLVGPAVVLGWAGWLQAVGRTIYSHLQGGAEWRAASGNSRNMFLGWKAMTVSCSSSMDSLQSVADMWRDYAYALQHLANPPPARAPGWMPGLFRPTTPAPSASSGPSVGELSSDVGRQLEIMIQTLGKMQSFCLERRILCSADDASRHPHFSNDRIIDLCSSCRNMEPLFQQPLMTIDSANSALSGMTPPFPLQAP